MDLIHALSVWNIVADFVIPTLGFTYVTRKMKENKKRRGIQ